MKERSICRRCHRVRAVNEVRYCAICAEALSKLERPRRQARPPNSAQPERLFVAPELEGVQP